MIDGEPGEPWRKQLAGAWQKAGMAWPSLHLHRRLYIYSIVTYIFYLEQIRCCLGMKTMSIVGALGWKLAIIAPKHRANGIQQGISPSAKAKRSP